MIRVDTVEQLFHMAAFLAHQPVPAGNRVGILTNAGGPGILATDACETWGLEIPDLAAETAAALRAFLPPEASVKNPVDMIASASAEDYERAARLLLADPAVDSVLAIFVPPLVTEAEAVARAIVRAAQGASKPMVSCLLGRQGMPDWLESAPHGNIPSYAFPETAVRVLARAARYGSWLRRPEGTERLFPDVDKTRVEAILALAGARLGREGGWLTPVEMEGIFAAYGILFTATRFAHDEEEAVVVAGELGYPVVVKLASETIAHKTDVEGVRLDLRSEDEVRRAVREIRQGLDRRGLAAAMQGVSIQRLVREGVEVFLGATQDPLFGPLVAFGLGGVQVELFHDVAFRIHPLTDQDAWDMVREIRGYPLLAGFRGAPVADQEALVDLILRVARLVADFPGLEEMDLNPVKVFPRARGLAAVDARVRLAPSGSDYE